MMHSQSIFHTRPNALLEFGGVLAGLGAIPEPTRPAVVAKPGAKPKRPQGKKATPANLAAWQTAQAKWEQQNSAYQQYQAELKQYNALVKQRNKELGQEKKQETAATKNAAKKELADAKKALAAEKAAEKKLAAAQKREQQIADKNAARADKLESQRLQNEHKIAYELARQGINPYETQQSAELIDPNTGFLKSHLIDWSANYDPLTPYASDFFVSPQNYGFSTDNPAYNDAYSGYFPAQDGATYEQNYFFNDQPESYGAFTPQLPTMFESEGGGLRPELMMEDGEGYADDYYNSIYGGWDDNGWDSGGIFDTLGAIQPPQKVANQVQAQKKPINTTGIESMLTFGAIALGLMYMLSPKAR